MLTNLGALTEIAVLAEAAEVTIRPDHLIVRCPAMPDFYWGNHLLLHRAPTADAVEHWLTVFAETFGDDPRIRHVAIGWQDHTGDAPAVDAFAARGYLIDDTVVTTLDTPPPARALPEGMTIDIARSDADWQAALELAIVSREARHTASAYRSYLDGIFAQRRIQAEAGRLRWYLAWIDGRVVGDMGLFVVREPPGGLPVDRLDVPLPIARFQAVKTHPDARKRGVCSSLLTSVCRDALGPLGVRRLVLMADPSGPAWRIYQRHGFRPMARLRGVWRPPTVDGAADPGD